MIYDLIGRFDNEDDRPQSVERLQKQYFVDTKQANRVADCALALWRQLKTPTIPAVSRTKLLTWAALLHEVGLAISHSGHHHHGHYILQNSDLAGFGRYEQNILAEMVRGQRKNPQRWLGLPRAGNISSTLTTAGVFALSGVVKPPPGGLTLCTEN